MITTIYIFILSYFLLGGAGFYFINRRKPAEVARESWTKFGMYFLIIHALFFGIVIDALAFRFMVAMIIVLGAFELFKLFWESDFKHRLFFCVASLIFVLLATGFWNFGGLPTGTILFSFLILSIFDAFSQISGQLFGKRKIVPAISPNKTWGGTLGGIVFAIISAFYLKDLVENTTLETLLLAGGVIVFAFVGDLAASFYKRKYQVKDFSKLIPGHGGFLDRFDSLVAGGAWVTLFSLCFEKLF